MSDYNGKANLIPITSRTPEERSEIARKGAEATNKKLKERKTMREQLELLMKLPLSPKQDKLREQIKELGIPDSEINMQMAMNVSMYQQAIKGNTKAYEIVRDTIGEKPIEQVENLNPPTIKLERPKDE